MSAGGAVRAGYGEPLVLIHGFSGVPQMWHPVVGRLEGSFEVLLVTLAGHAGGPDLPAGAVPSVEALVDQVERDMDAAGFQDAHLAGNSLGGWIALELAARGRARSVTALSPAGGWEPGGRQERRLRRLFTRNHALVTRSLPYMRGLLCRPRLRRAVLSGAMARADRIGPEAALTIIRGAAECSIYFELMEAIMRDGPPQSFEGVDCPLLLAWGTKDRVLPAKGYSERMRALLPHARWMELKGLGHVPMGDDPDLIAQLIAELATPRVIPADRAAAHS